MICKHCGEIIDDDEVRAYLINKPWPRNQAFDNELVEPDVPFGNDED
jgi:hypothetical protein